MRCFRVSRGPDAPAAGHPCVPLGGGRLAADPQELAAAIAASGVVELPVTAVHAASVGRLELHHDDPFDRLLIAQALAEPLRLRTAGETLARYSDLAVRVGDIGRS